MGDKSAFCWEAEVRLVHGAAGEVRAGASAAETASLSAGLTSKCPDIQAVIDKHNEYRAAHHAPPLYWSESLAHAAQSWADKGELQQSETECGENLALGVDSCATAVDMWYEERSGYKGEFSPSSCHFSQLVWKGSRQVGCGCNAEQRLVVCNYLPPGNVKEEFDANVER
ncbi:hypothetical protein N2152v2_000207 [Parachlorella kessleri]